MFYIIKYIHIYNIYITDGRRNTVSTSYLERIGQRLGLVSRSQNNITQGIPSHPHTLIHDTSP